MCGRVLLFAPSQMPDLFTFARPVGKEREQKILLEGDLFLAIMTLSFSLISHSSFVRMPSSERQDIKQKCHPSPIPILPYRYSKKHSALRQTSSYPSTHPARSKSIFGTLSRTALLVLDPALQLLWAPGPNVFIRRDWQNVDHRD